MLTKNDLIQFASQASNLNERLAILHELRQNKIPLPDVTLSKFDHWTLNKITGKLAMFLFKEHVIHETEYPALSKTALLEMLQNYKQYTLDLAKLPESAQAIFLNQHADWLDTYQSALKTLNLPQTDFANIIWNDDEIYYGRFAKTCEPFLRLIQQRLAPIIKSHTCIRVNSRFIVNMQLHLLNRLEVALARTVEADINLYCHQHNFSKSDDKEGYIAYFEQTFCTWEHYHRFYCKFPVLGRWLAKVTNFLCIIGEEILQRLTTDMNEISATIFDGRSIMEIKSLNLGHSDPHANGHSVAIMELVLDNGEIKGLVYKPRDVQIELALQHTLEFLTYKQVMPFATYRILNKHGYGYAEFIPHDRNHVQDESDIQTFYQQMGGYLALCHILGGGDIHHENILVADGNAFICDAEVLLDVRLRGMEEMPDTIMDSVFRVGMLDWPRAEPTDDSQLIRLGGYTGGESYHTPMPTPQIKNRMSLALMVQNESGGFVDITGSNRVFHDGEIIHPQPYQADILKGFNRIYTWIKQNQQSFAKAISQHFANSFIRFINRPTQVYAVLIHTVRHPKCLSDPLEVDLIFYSLLDELRIWDDKGKLAKLEMATLWQLDIPIFTAKADSKDLIFNHANHLADLLKISPLENTLSRISRLSEEDQKRQNQYVHASFSANEVNNPHFIRTAVNYAIQIGWELCHAMSIDSNTAPWKTIDISLEGKAKIDIDGSLYDGVAGISLFLAYLDSVQPNPSFRQAAEYALNYALNHVDKTFIGAYKGIAGIIYLLVHLGYLWNRPELFAKGVELGKEISKQLNQSQDFDIICGSSGVIPIMLMLNKVTPCNGIDVAKACGDHLLQHGTYQKDTLSWHHPPIIARKNLTGFSHGTAGIGWALIILGCQTNEEKYIEAGRKAFAYESQQFDSTQQNWYDWRSTMIGKDSNEPKFAHFWCSGAAGIGLSRISSWAMLGKKDKNLVQDVYYALDDTLKTFHMLDNDCLCHGKTGNAELLLRCAKILDEPYLQIEANVQATLQWHHFERTRRWACTAGGNDTFPDLMLGIAGVGLHFLRLAHPDKIPSPLLLDPPIFN